VRPLDRRTLLRGAGAGLLAAGIAACDTSSGPVDIPTKPPTALVTTHSGSFRSAARNGIEVGYEIILPPGHVSAAGLPVCLVLHGRGDDYQAAVKLVHLDTALATVTAGGAPPMALVSVDGGSNTYWHRRGDGDDPQRMLLDELLPLLAKTGAKTDQFGMFGWSMGAYGSLLLAEGPGYGRVAFIAGDSPALWLTAKEGVTIGAFDDAADYAEHNVFTSVSNLAGVPVRLMCGQSDYFVTGTREFAKVVPDLVAADYPVGNHDPKLWAATAVSQLTPMAHALA
jgi:enterochelin esterase-like enzyme